MIHQGKTEWEASFNRDNAMIRMAFVIPRICITGYPFSLRVTGSFDETKRRERANKFIFGVFQHNNRAQANLLYAPKQKADCKSGVKRLSTCLPAIPGPVSLTDITF